MTNYGQQCLGVTSYGQQHWVLTSCGQQCLGPTSYGQQCLEVTSYAQQCLVLASCGQQCLGPTSYGQQCLGVTRHSFALLTVPSLFSNYIKIIWQVLANRLWVDVMFQTPAHGVSLSPLPYLPYVLRCDMPHGRSLRLWTTESSSKSAWPCGREEEWTGGENNLG